MPSLDADSNYAGFIGLDDTHLPTSDNLFFGVDNGSYRARIGNEEITGTVSAGTQRWVVGIDINTTGLD